MCCRMCRRLVIMSQHGGWTGKGSACISNYYGIGTFVTLRHPLTLAVPVLGSPVFDRLRQLPLRDLHLWTLSCCPSFIHLVAHNAGGVLAGSVSFDTHVRGTAQPPASQKLQHWLAASCC